MSTQKNLNKFLEELIQEVEKELDEATATGNVAGYNTPAAFSDGGTKDKKRKKKIATTLGYSVVGNDVGNIDEVGKGSNWAEKYVNDTNLYKKLNWYIKMGKGAEKKIKGKEFVIMSDGSALIWNTKTSDWELYKPKRIDKKTGKPTYESVNEANVKSKDSRGMRFAEAIYNNVSAIIKAVEREKMDVDRVVNSFGPVLVNAIKTTLKHKFKPTAGNEDKLKSFYSELKELLKVAESLVKRPSKAGIKKLDASHREWWNHNGGADVVLNGKYADNIIESVVNEAKVKRPVNRWLELKNDETMHPHKKMAMGLKELKYQLRETEKFFNWYGKIKSMNELDSSDYWKRTNKHIYKIKERLINIAKTIQEIEK